MSIKKSKQERSLWKWTCLGAFSCSKQMAHCQQKKGPHVYPPQRRLGNVHLPWMDSRIWSKQPIEDENTHMVLLHKLPFKYRPIGSLIIIKQVGIMLRFDENNHVNLNPRLCFLMEVDKGKATMLMIGAIKNQWFTITLHYEFNPIRCRSCMNLHHKVSECS